MTIIGTAFLSINYWNIKIQQNDPWISCDSYRLFIPWTWLANYWWQLGIQFFSILFLFPGWTNPDCKILVLLFTSKRVRISDSTSSHYSITNPTRTNQVTLPKPLSSIGFHSSSEPIPSGINSFRISHSFSSLILSSSPSFIKRVSREYQEKICLACNRYTRYLNLKKAKYPSFGGN